MPTRKGTGWVPDFPDIRDYTLSSQEIQNVVDTTGSETVASSVENLAGRITETFKALLDHVDADAVAALTRTIEQEFLERSLSFRSVQVHQYLEEGSHSSEVLRVKGYLREFILRLDLPTEAVLLRHIAKRQTPPNTPERVQALIEEVKADFEWWFQQRADQRFVVLLQLYQVYKEQRLKASEGVEAHTVEISSDPCDGLARSHHPNGVVYPETLALFEIEPTHQLYRNQLDELEAKVDQLDAARIGELIEQIQQPQQATFYNLGPISSPTLTQKVRDIQSKYYSQYLQHTLPAAAVELIKEYEGFEPKAYRDAVGIWTVGYGYTRHVSPGQTVTEEQATQLLLLELQGFAQDVLAAVTVPLNPNQFGALLSFVYNVGVNALQESELLRLVNEGNYDQAAEEFARWTKAGGHVMEGLVRRRERERELFTRSWQEKPSSNSYGSQPQLIEQLLPELKAELKQAVAASREQIEKERNIRVKRLSISWQLPQEVATALEANVLSMIREAHGGSLDLSHEGITAADIEDTLKGLIAPVVEAIGQVLSPMGRYSTVNRAIEQAVEVFKTVLQQPKLEPVAELLSAIAQTNAIAPHSRAASIVNSIIAALLRAEIQAQEETKRAEQYWQKCVDDFNAMTAQVALAAQRRESIDQFNRDLQERRHWMEQAGKQLNRYSIAAVALQRFIAQCAIDDGRRAAIATGYSNHRPTLLYVPPMLPSSHPSDKQRTKTADTLQIPIDSSLRRQIQEAASAEGLERGSDSRQTWLYLSLPEFVDLSYWCSDVEDQGALNTCTAHAGVALVEYFAKKTFGRYEDLSARFLYKVARNLMHRQGDTGASVRETMRAMVLFGLPPEEHWSYTETGDFDSEPDQFCYAYAQNYQAVKYCRLDHAGISPKALLAQIKAVLVSGLPCMFGFTVYSSIHEPRNVRLGHISYPGEFDEMEGGHAVVAVGYDDQRVIESADGKLRWPYGAGLRPSQGAILIRNSWGRSWGEGGYGWLPYDYVLAGLTADWWALLKSEWFANGQFGAGTSGWSSSLGGQDRKKD